MNKNKLRSEYITDNISSLISIMCFNSLSRREESSKHKLSACLLVCPHFTD